MQDDPARYLRVGGPLSLCRPATLPAAIFTDAVFSERLDTVMRQRPLHDASGMDRDRELRTLEVIRLVACRECALYVVCTPKAKSHCSREVTVMRSAPCHACRLDVSDVQTFAFTRGSSASNVGTVTLPGGRKERVRFSEHEPATIDAVFGPARAARWVVVARWGPG